MKQAYYTIEDMKRQAAFDQSARQPDRKLTARMQAMAERVWGALDRPRTVTDLKHHLKLDESNIRNAIRFLEAEGRVRREVLYSIRIYERA